LGFRKWLKGATRIRFDDRTLGNLTKNAGVVGGTIVGGPLGLAIGAGGGALGQAALGGNLKESLNAGLKGAANTGFAQAGKGLLSKAVGGGAPALPTAGAATPPPPVPTGGLPMPSVPNLTSITEKAIDPRNFIGKVGDQAGSVLDWASDHPNAAAGALKGVGSIMTSGAENRTHNAQADLLEQQANETAYDFERRKMRDAQLAPVWSSLGNTIGNSYAGVAKNPYLPAGA
jgi:hypothetical protein